FRSPPAPCARISRPSASRSCTGSSTPPGARCTRSPGACTPRTSIRTACTCSASRSPPIASPWSTSAIWRSATPTTTRSTACAGACPRSKEGPSPRAESSTWRPTTPRRASPSSTRRAAPGSATSRSPSAPVGPCSPTKRSRDSISSISTRGRCRPCPVSCTCSCGRRSRSGATGSSTGESRTAPSATCSEKRPPATAFPRAGDRQAPRDRRLCPSGLGVPGLQELRAEGLEGAPHHVLVHVRDDRRDALLRLVRLAHVRRGPLAPLEHEGLSLPGDLEARADADAGAENPRLRLPAHEAAGEPLGVGEGEGRHLDLGERLVDVLGGPQEAELQHVLGEAPLQPLDQ